MAVDDSKKLKMLVWATGALCLLALTANVASEYFLPDMKGYIDRRVYFERVISGKGLSMHNALHWKKVETRD